MPLPLRNVNLRSVARLAFAVLFFTIGLYRLIAHHGYPGHPLLTITNQLGLMFLGVLIFLGVFTRFSKTVFFLFAALLYALFMDEKILTPMGAQRIATVVVMGLMVYFFYKLIRVTFLARKDTADRQRRRSDFGSVEHQRLLPTDSPYHSHLENKEFLVRDMSKSKNNSLVGYENCWGTRWHFGPLWFENFFGDLEPPHGKDGPLRVVVWQPMHDVAASRGWKLTRLLKYNHMTGFATLSQADYWTQWSEHARRQRNKWLKAQAEWEVYQPTPQAFFHAYRTCHQGILLKFYFSNLIKQLLLTHNESIVFSAIRRRGTDGPMLAGFVAHDIPSAKTSRHIASFILPSAKSSPLGIGLMDTWFIEAIKKGYQYLDFGVFWMPGDPESWKGFSRFKGQFGITYVQYPPARLRRAGSLSNVFPAIIRSR